MIVDTIGNWTEASQTRVNFMDFWSIKTGYDAPTPLDGVFVKVFTV
jgi:hypothetical protein